MITLAYQLVQSLCLSLLVVFDVGFLPTNAPTSLPGAEHAGAPAGDGHPGRVQQVAHPAPQPGHCGHRPALPGDGDDDDDDNNE